MWVVGAYHPITKHLNLVAEYAEVTGTSDNLTVASTTYRATTGAKLTTAQSAGRVKGETKTISLGAILFF